MVILILHGLMLTSKKSIKSYSTFKTGYLVYLLNICVADTVTSCRCRKLPKGLKEWPAYNELKDKIDDFNQACPLLELMANPAMKLRHWGRIATLTKHSFDVGK